MNVIQKVGIVSAFLFIGNSVYGQALTTVTGSGNNLPTGLSGGGNFINSITQEIEQILGEAENDIMQGIKDEVMNLVNSALMNVIGASPAGEVIATRNLMKDAYSKAQKIEYQNYKVEYEEKKANTELSSAFVQYYDDLNLKDKFDRLDKLNGSVKALLNTKSFTSDEVKAVQDYLNQSGRSQDLISEVRTACNLNQQAVWMSEAERVQILETVRQEVTRRIQEVTKLRANVVNAYVFRNKKKVTDAASKALYNPNTSINRDLQSN